jgi:hypothetical protein
LEDGSANLSCETGVGVLREEHKRQQGDREHGVLGWGARWPRFKSADERRLFHRSGHPGCRDFR